MRRLCFIIRKLVYFIGEGSKLPRMGKGCEIHPYAAFHGQSKLIELGNDVSVRDFARLHCNKEASIKIGDGTVIGWNTIINTTKRGGFVHIGKDCSVNSYTVISGSGGVTIGDKVRIAHHVTIVAGNHVFADPDKPIKEQGVTRKGITIEDDVWIAAGVQILDGVKIGKGAVVAAGSLVNKDVEPYTVVGGIPAKVIKERK